MHDTAAAIGGGLSLSCCAARSRSACFSLAVRLVQGHGLLDAFLSAVTPAVAAIPEGFLGGHGNVPRRGVYRLARRRRRAGARWPLKTSAG
jgi:hypothetical protein